MANTFNPFGFNQIGIADGTAANFALVTRALSSGAGAIFRGDPVMMLSTGYIAQWSAGTAVSQLIGIFWGCTYNTTTGSGVTRSIYWPGSGAGASGDVFAEIRPCIQGSGVPQFLVQTANSNTTATAFALTDIGQNIDVALGGGNTTTGYSTAYADQHTEGTTATLPFRIVGLWSGGILNPIASAPYGGTGNGSDLTTAYNYVIVQANNYQQTGI
jgi:hypothetical protein